MINLPSKMCKEESSPHDVLCGRHQSEPCSVSGGEVGRALYLRLYLHRCSLDGAYLMFGYVFVFAFVLICVLHNV